MKSNDAHPLDKAWSALQKDDVDTVNQIIPVLSKAYINPEWRSEFTISILEDAARVGALKCFKMLLEYPPAYESLALVSNKVLVSTMEAGQLSILERLLQEEIVQAKITDAMLIEAVNQEGIESHLSCIRFFLGKIGADETKATFIKEQLIGRNTLVVDYLNSKLWKADMVVFRSLSKMNLSSSIGASQKLELGDMLTASKVEIPKYGDYITQLPKLFREVSKDIFYIALAAKSSSQNFLYDIKQIDAFAQAIAAVVGSRLPNVVVVELWKNIDDIISERKQDASFAVLPVIEKTLQKHIFTTLQSALVNPDKLSAHFAKEGNLQR